MVQLSQDSDHKSDNNSDTHYTDKDSIDVTLETQADSLVNDATTRFEEIGEQAIWNKSGEIGERETFKTINGVRENTLSYWDPKNDHKPAMSGDNPNDPSNSAFSKQESETLDEANDTRICIESGGVTTQLSRDGDDDVTTDTVVGESKMPIDRGWAWLVMLGTMLEMTIIVGTLKSAGIIFVAFQERFNSTSSMTSLISTVQNAVFSLTAPLVLSIGMRVTSSRWLLFIGSSIICTAYIVTSQARDMRLLLFSHGVLQGIGSAFMQPVAIVTLASYFDKKRGFANSFAVSGGSIGGLVFAPVLNLLLDQYGYQGCFLVMAAIYLHGFIAGALYRPKTFYEKKIKKTVTEKSSEHERQSLVQTSTKDDSGGKQVNGINGSAKKLQRAKSLEQRVVERQFSQGHDNVVDIRLINSDIQLQRKSVRKRTLTETSTKSSFVSRLSSIDSVNSYMCGSALDIAAEAEIENEKNRMDKAKDKENTKVSIKSLLKMVLKSFDFTLFRNPMFCVLQAASFVICANTSLSAIYIAPHIRDMGFQVKDIALIVTVCSSTDVVSRITIALISDRGWMRRSNITATTTLIIGIAGNFLRLYTSYEFLMFYGILLGLFSGVYFSLVSVLIVDYLTIHRLQAAFGFTALFHGAGVSIFFYLIGYLRDITGSYIIPFHVMGCCCIIGSALHFSLPFVERYHQRRQAKTEHAEKL